MSNEEEAEVEKEAEVEEVEEAEEILIDQLRLLLDVTKLWHKILHGEASIDDLKTLLEVKPVERGAEVRARAQPRRSGKKTKKSRLKETRNGLMSTK